MTSREVLEKAWDLVHNKYPENNEEIQLVRYAIKTAMELTKRIGELESKLIKQEKLLELYKDLANYRSRVIHKLLDEISCLTDRDTTKEEDINYILDEAKMYGYEDKKIIEEIKKIKESGMIKLKITRKKPTKLSVNFLVESIEVVDNTLSFKQDGLTHKYNLENYTFTINGNKNEEV